MLQFPKQPLVKKPVDLELGSK